MRSWWSQRQTIQTRPNRNQNGNFCLFEANNFLFLFCPLTKKIVRYLFMVGGFGQRIHPPRLHPSNFELKRNASSLRSYLSKFVYIYIYMRWFYLFSLIFFIPFYAVSGSSRCCSIPYLWSENGARDEYLSILFQSGSSLGGGWPVERSPLPRNLFKYYFIGYRKRSRELFLIRYFIVFNIPRYFLGKKRMFTIYWNYWKVVLFRKIRIQERERERGDTNYNFDSFVQFF